MTQTLTRTLDEWMRHLVTYQEGQVWAVWADGENIVRMCRLDGDGFWATLRGHMQEADMLKGGWRKVS